MKDRTLILAGVLFLIIAIGVGVNKSLAAGNRMVGAPLAPEIRDIYEQSAPAARERAENMAEQGKAQGKLLYLTYSAEFAEGFAEVKTRVNSYTREAAVFLKQELRVLGRKAAQAAGTARHEVYRVKEIIVFEKNKQVQ